mmetsp:Transcript_17257/g.52176  ORF Transcript_17257/g.52176 Transcript_17257/m.52176 type:complete len:104 (-) Transcript_17257:523-834(-)
MRCFSGIQARPLVCDVTVESCTLVEMGRSEEGCPGDPDINSVLLVATLSRLAGALGADGSFFVFFAIFSQISGGHSSSLSFPKSFRKAFLESAAGGGGRPVAL